MVKLVHDMLLLQYSVPSNETIHCLGIIFIWQLFIHMLCEQCTHMYKLFVALGKLRLKVPWSNLYSAPVVVEVDGVYIVAGPLSGEF